MKIIAALLMLFFMTNTSFAQTAANPYPKSITVTGTAEMEITPNEIYVQVDLKEYEKKGGDKVTIEKIKQDFLAAAKSIGLADTAITITQFDGFSGNPWLLKKKKKEELFASITYQVKIKDSKQLDELVSKLDDNATQNFFIQRTSHSGLAELRKNLKIEAVKAAKEKAKYLATAIDERVGVAITINEPTEYYVPFYNSRVSNMMKTEAARTTDEASSPDFKKIKLKYDVTVVFALI